MITLAWDTAGSSQAAALLIDGEVRTERYQAGGASHSETLIPIIESLLVDSRLQLSEVDLFALTVGPGSFTGLRIGIATLKAFAQVFDRPVAPVSSLEALAQPFIPASPVVVPCLDARLGEVFVAAFGSSPLTGGALPEDAMPLKDFLSWLQAQPGEKTVLGTGAILHRAVLEKIPGVRIPEDERAHAISGPAVGTLGERIWREGKALKAREITPRYLRPSEAQSRRSGQGTGNLT